MGVDEGVEGLVALAVALGLPGADGTAPLEAGDDALGGQLAEVVGVQTAREVNGAGTGLGVAHLVHVDKRWVSLPGEGGHVDFAPNSEEEGIILEELRAELGHVSAERVLSGPGLVNLYRAIVKSDGRLPENLQPREVTERALADSCTDCRRALSLFCVIMGRFGGNLALTLGTFGGVYIAGGIVPRFLEFFKASGFRGGFEDKGRFKAYVQDIPVYLIVHDNPGLLGSGAHLRQTLGQVL